MDDIFQKRVIAKKKIRELAEQESWRMHHDLVDSTIVSFEKGYTTAERMTAKTMTQMIEAFPEISGAELVESFKKVRGIE